jgi:hypothetical protein
MSKWVENYIEDNLVSTSWGDYEGITKISLTQLHTLKSLIEMQIQHELTNMQKDEE